MENIAEPTDRVVAKTKRARAHQGISLYSEAIAARIVDQIQQGQTLRTVCMHDNMPTHSTVYLWMKKNPDFKQAIEDAREVGYSFILDEISDIADDCEETSGSVAKAKLRIKTKLEILDRIEAQKARLNQPKDPKLVEAEKDDKSGEWRVADNGERANPISEAIQRALNPRKKAEAPVES